MPPTTANYGLPRCACDYSSCAGRESQRALVAWSFLQRISFDSNSVRGRGDNEEGKESPEKPEVCEKREESRSGSLLMLVPLVNLCRMPPLFSLPKQPSNQRIVYTMDCFLGNNDPLAPSGFHVIATVPNCCSRDDFFY